MNPVAFEVFGMPIMWYGIIISCGVVAALVLANFFSHEKRLGL